MRPLTLEEQQELRELQRDYPERNFTARDFILANPPAPDGPFLYKPGSSTSTTMTPQVDKAAGDLTHADFKNLTAEQRVALQRECDDMNRAFPDREKPYTLKDITSANIAPKF